VSCERLGRERDGRDSLADAFDDFRLGRDIVNIILARGRLQQIKHIGTGGSAMNPSRGNPTQGKLTARLL
jgi:hypothetical protein